MRDLLLEEVFRLLEDATRLEKSGQHRIEAATKYYEGCYLLRQIVAAAEAKSSKQRNDDDEQTIGRSSRRLLENKIDHYTTIARMLYFEDGSVPVRPENPQQEQQQKKKQQQHRNQQQHEQKKQPATSVMIDLLDDAISVLTEIPPIPPPISVPVLGYNKEALTSRRNLPNATTPASANCYQSTEGRKRTTTAMNNNNNNNNNSSNNNRSHHQQKPLQKHQSNQQNRQSRWIKTPRNALAAIERNIHLRANLAHSTLSKAIDIDEKHLNGNQTRANAIATYVEASELYLGAIQLGEDQKNKINARRRNTSSTSSSSAGLVRTMEDCLNTLLSKLKRLLVSALDRVEALKNEEEQQKQQSFFVQRHFTSSASMTTSILPIPIASKVQKSFPFHCLFRATENSINRSVKTKEKSNSKAQGRQGQSPTMVVW